MDKSLRNQLRNTVTAARKLLEGAISERLEGQFGIFPSGKVEDIAQLGHLSAENQGYRQQLVIHLEHIRAGGLKPKDATEQLIREVAFTHLNRLCAYKLMEARGLIRESVSRGVKSQGFFFYLADHPEDEALAKAGETEKAYRHFLRWLSGTLSEELGALFAPDDPADRLYPPLRVLDQVLELLNAEELKAIWTEDETIGWVYQYFTPKELRDKSHKESRAPRNSYEMAFRNQFYTPRYVVEFLTDNTLGRTWYEMRQGNTGLVETCRYLVRRPNEVWLKEGEEVHQGGAEDTESEKTQEELLKEPVYIPFRALKDPRDLKILDPACGSGHFLLYCFDLLERIYAEAWQECPEVFSDLRGDIDEAEFLRRVPGMILRHNLHGIDIDLRATQIASLALWLRAQKTYQALGLRREERPKITRANIVCAEPMPGEPELLEEFCQGLQPPLIGQLVKTIFEKMKLAGEAGSLLKIEQELEEAIQAAKAQMDEQPQAEQLAFWPAASKPKQMAFDLRGIAKSDAEFWQTVEKRVLEALQEYAARAVNGQGYRRKLFAGDAAQGFAFIDLCQKRFDVVLMNPPFGEASENTEDYLARKYPSWNKNILCAFIDRFITSGISNGFIGSVIDRTIEIKNTYEPFRKEVILKPGIFQSQVDLGWGVLDAFVEVAAYIVSTTPQKSYELFFNVANSSHDEKPNNLEWQVNTSINGKLFRGAYLINPVDFMKFPNSVTSLEFPNFLRKLFAHEISLEEAGFQAIVGHSFKSERHFRLRWELPPKQKIGFNIHQWSYVFNGGEYAPLYKPPYDVVYYGVNGDLIKDHDSVTLRSIEKHGQLSVAYGKRGEFIDAQVLHPGFVLTVEGEGSPVSSSDEAYLFSAYLSSWLFQFGINTYCGQHKYPGYVNIFPFPRVMLGARGQAIIESSKHIYCIKAQFEKGNELDVNFVKPHMFLYWDKNKNLSQNILSIEEEINKKNEEIRNLWIKINMDFLNVISLDRFEYDQILLYSKKIPKDGLDLENWQDGASTSYYLISEIISYLAGVILGRWDIRNITSDIDRPLLSPIDLPIPKAELGGLVEVSGFPASKDMIVSEAWLRARPDAITLPKMVDDQVVGKDGQLHPATIPDEEYPIRIAWDGILADDPDHPDDIVTRSHDVLELLFPGRGEVVEQEACQVLGVKTLREYFRKPGTGGFWMDHVKRYSKSRRKAPIYWLLQSSRKNYALWLYYHRLDKDLLFKALTQYVEPKIRLEEEHLKTLRAQRGTFGTGGRQAKELDQAMERQEDLLVELEDFRDKLRRAADLDLEPDLNDGVVLNIAPLWELVPWGEAKKYWQELLEGKYEWSSIGKQLRAKGLVK